MKKIFLTFILLISTNAFAKFSIEPFQAHYLVYYGRIELGEAIYRFEHGENNNYKLDFSSSLALLVLSDTRQLSSEFSYDGNNTIPMRFFHNRQGFGEDYQEQTAFLKEMGMVHTRYKEERGKYDYRPDIYDPLGVQLQFRHELLSKPEQKEFSYQLVKSNEVDEYRLARDGEETITLFEKSYPTERVKVVRDSNKRETFMWFSKSHNLLPVKLSHYVDGSLQIEMRLFKYHDAADLTMPEPKAAEQAASGANG